MQLRTKIAAGAAAASAAVLALVLSYSLHDDGQIRGSVPQQTSAPRPATPPTGPIVADQKTVVAGRNARIDAFFQMVERQEPTAAMYLAMRSEFPQRYAEIRDTMRAEMESAQPPANPSMRLAQLTRESLDGMKDLVRQSSDESLRRVAAAQYALLGTLAAQDQNACARYAAEGGDASMPITPAITQAISGLATVQINAAGDAARSPKKRSAPTPATFLRLAQTMQQEGITDQQIYLLGDGKLGSLPADEQCKVAMSMYHSALRLTPAEAGTVLAAIIKS